jgi:PAS domain S-box-containing protein
MAGERTSDLELRVLRADGAARLVEISIAPLTMQGAVAGLQGIARDVTSRRRAEQALRESEELFRTLTERSPDCIALHDGELRHRYVNPAITRLTGLPREAFIGKTVLEIGLPPEVAARLDSLLRRTLDTGRETSGELTLPAASGPRFFQWQSVPLFAPDGSVRAVLAIAGDITRYKKMERALKENAVTLAFTNKELEEFSVAISNDLRAPLRAIEGFTSAIIEDYGATFDDTEKDYFNRVLSASRRMSQLIDAMLAMARLTKGELREKSVDLSRLASVIARELRKKAPGRSVEFVLAPDVKAKGDMDMLRTVLENLLDNAWKFTGKQAAAKIEFGTVDKSGETAYYVRDNGAGFDMRYADKLFMPFHRLHGDSEFPGLGIGLPIAHRIILRHGGRIWAEAAPEQGATFYFTL